MISHGGLKYPRVLKEIDVTTRATRYRSGHTVAQPSEQALPDKAFYRIDDRGTVHCVYCDCKLYCWAPGDDLWVEHARWYPTCGFVHLMKGEQFVLHCQQLQERFLSRARAKPLNRMPTRNNADSPAGLSDYLWGTLDTILNSEGAQFYLSRGVPRELVITTVRGVLLADQDRLRRDSQAALTDLLCLGEDKETERTTTRAQVTYEAESVAESVEDQSSDDETLLSELEARISEAECRLRRAKARLRQSTTRRTIRKRSAHRSGLKELERQARLRSSESPPRSADTPGAAKERPTNETGTCATTKPSPQTENEIPNRFEKQTEKMPQPKVRQGDEFPRATEMEMEEAEPNKDKVEIEDLCHYCTTRKVRVTFEPCGHTIACLRCAPPIRQCSSCWKAIEFISVLSE